MDVGRHCTTCGRLDFLPFDCRRCGSVFCSDHRVHECDVPASTQASSKPQAAPRTQVRTQVSAHARQAGSSSGSRSSSSTQTETKTQTKTQPRQAQAQPAAKAKASGQRLGSGPVKSERAVAALDRLKQLVGAGPKPSKPNVRNGASAELRREATGDHRVPQSERVYFYIERTAHEVRDPLTQAMSTRPPKTAAMYFDRQASAGQVLDRASRQLAVPHASLLIEGAPVDLATAAKDLPQRLTLVAQ